jgi:hypothetical protein
MVGNSSALWLRSCASKLLRDPQENLAPNTLLEASSDTQPPTPPTWHSYSNPRWSGYLACNELTKTSNAGSSRRFLR